ncbi:hypothetical protein KY284_012133 [Solanum tuberosum]|nr:hypothetical protein KY284_012133 [Solanum tuberosum]
MVELTSASTASASNSTSSGVDTGSPFYIHPSDSPGAVLVPVPFDGTDATHSTYRQWVRCDDMVMSWILNSLGRDIAYSVEYVSDALELWTELVDRYDQTNGAKLYQTQKEINDLSQGILDITTYYTCMKKLWEELNNLCVLSQCNCVCICGAKANTHKAEQDRRLIQFLMGLNVVYTTIRGSILMMNPLPSMAQAFALLIQEEKQREFKPNNQMFAESSSLIASSPDVPGEGQVMLRTNATSYMVIHLVDHLQTLLILNPPTIMAQTSIRKLLTLISTIQDKPTVLTQITGGQNISITKEQYDQVAHLLDQFQDTNTVVDQNVVTCGAGNFAVKRKLMASRAIQRRRRFLSDYLNVSAWSIQNLQSWGNGQSAHYFDPCGFSSTMNCICQGSDKRKDHDEVSPINDGFSGLGFFPTKRYSTTVFGYLNRRVDVVPSTGMSLWPYSVRCASTATAKQPNLGSDDEEELITKKKSEASPEECDQAVVGLSTAKAKAKAKRLQESQKVAKSVIQRVWATLLGIGPSLRMVASMSREDWTKKLAHWKHEFTSTLQHYWLGFKLLWADMRISSRLLIKLASGKSLSRRERQQLTRTTADMFRLVPFAVFIIVPFMEFLLPVFLKLFPNMLPSTFQDKMKEQEALKRRLIARIEYAKFLQDTVKEMAKEVQNSRSGELKKTAEDLDEFLSKVRRGAGVTNEEILGFAKLFNDELTLDNISRSRLVSMCKYMGISPYGTDAYLRFMLRKRLQRIKVDDKLIQAEGVESLSEAELREDCRERGMLGLFSVEEMRQQLRDWLDLSLNHSVPSSLLILSRSFTVSGRLKPEEVVGATLSSLPDEVVGTVGITSLPSEDSLSERRRKLEFLKMQEELIKEEEEKEKEEEEKSRRKESVCTREDVALKEMTVPTATEAQEQARARAIDKQEQLCKISRALSVLASASSVSQEREEFLRLVNKEIELYHSMIDEEGTVGEVDAMKAYRAAHDENDHAAEHDEVSSALIDKVNSSVLLDNPAWDYDGKVTPEELAAAAMYLKDTLGKEGVQELISNLSKDTEGKIFVEDIVKLGSRVEDASLGGQSYLVPVLVGGGRNPWRCVKVGQSVHMLGVQGKGSRVN